MIAAVTVGCALQENRIVKVNHPEEMYPPVRVFGHPEVEPMPPCVPFESLLPESESLALLPVGGKDAPLG